MVRDSKTARVLAEWDREAEVWVATSYDIPGLVLSSLKKDELEAKILSVAAPLIQANLGTNPYDKIQIDYIEPKIVSVLAA